MIRLVRSPDNTPLFKARDLKPDEAESISKDIRVKRERRLGDFRTFKDLIEQSDSPMAALANRFGN